jgi:uncharacterized protein YoxC
MIEIALYLAIFVTFTITTTLSANRNNTKTNNQLTALNQAIQEVKMSNVEILQKMGCLEDKITTLTRRVGDLESKQYK